jgi:hypothetical protein
VHFVTVAQQTAGDVGADEARGACQENPHAIGWFTGVSATSHTECDC